MEQELIQLKNVKKANRGTKITLILKDDLDEDENYLDQYKIQELVKNTPTI